MKNFPIDGLITRHGGQVARAKIDATGDEYREKKKHLSAKSIIAAVPRMDELKIFCEY